MNRILNTWTSKPERKNYIEVGDPIYQKGDYRIFRQSSEVWLYTYKDVAINQLAGLNKELIDTLASGKIITKYRKKFLFDRAIESKEKGLKLTHLK